MNSIVRTSIKRLLPSLIVEKGVALLDYVYSLRFGSLISRNRLLKGRFNGERVFIIGSGKSLLKQDLSKLKNENVIMLNNFYRNSFYNSIVEGRGWKGYLVAPFHSPQGRKEWAAWLDAIKSVSSASAFFLGLSRYVDNAFSVNQEFKILEKDDVNWFFVSSVSQRGSFDGFVQPGRAASVYALQLAKHLGFEEINLLGMDHDYFLSNDESGMRFYASSEHQVNEIERTFGDRFYVDEYLRQYEVFNFYYDFQKRNPNIKILNLSPSSMCRVFKYKEYSEIEFH